MSELTQEELELLLLNKSNVQGLVHVDTVIDLLQAHDEAATSPGGSV